MRTTQQLSITLPNEMANMVKAKVQSGEYATESEVIRDGLRVLMARDRAVENWLHHQVGPAYDALKADPERAVTVGQVRARLAAKHDDVVQKWHSQEAYEQWFARKVAEGRADVRLGRVVDNETAIAQAAERRQRLLARLGEGQ